MKKSKKLYTKEKLKLFTLLHDKNLVIQYFKDDATAFQ